MPHTILSNHIRPILGAIRSIPVPAKGFGQQVISAQPFITISREPGAGGWSLARHLVDALNIAHPNDEHVWTCWDRELVEKVATDLQLSTTLIDSLEDRGHSWLSDFLGSLSLSDSGVRSDEPRIYSRVAATIRALAQTGRVVIVGRGGVFITRKMHGGVHIRLVAPLQARAALFAREFHLAPEQALAKLKDLEHHRSAFYRHYWPGEKLNPEDFTLTINTATVDQATMVEMIATLVRNLAARAN